ncbi:nickel pincer cofactor biosynthesis protein LarB [Acidipila sp. EB88]|uniref:nickel pincer cofactor biosynthesis protein LarB n=1 Tax=Acidipila sp. EB88 TaxID=2305226 RepID=UPI000F5E0FCF|nr:nickel pincer cofactor biosynthesis protein LarB [Acidipila sp. EB88]RRA50017.1 nickel pincer cofactor biosynthesis protein LarB [Acidipila sp. EB88]
MQREVLLALLRAYKSGESTEAELADRLTSLPFEDVGFARIDHHRSLRSGMPEAIYAEGKTPDQVATIFARLAVTGVPVLATRATEAHAAATQAVTPSATYHRLARCITLAATDGREQRDGHIAVVCAGTSDLPVAEEAALTAELYGAAVTRVTDVGVAGLHRLLAQVPVLRTADVVIACAGMEGALPSVIGGLVASPVIAVPTSVGYGASLGGIAALLGMLNSCSPNIAVVNIDNGFGAGYLACLIARQAK